MSAHLGFVPTPVLESGEWSALLHAARMFGVRAWWSVVPNRGELARRHGAQIGALRRLAVVDVLLGLPLDEPVAERSLLPRELRALAGLPSCVVDRGGGRVVRRASPPLGIDQVVVPARAFRRGLEAASSFSTYCARSMALAAAVDPSQTELAEASYYGVGVYIADGDHLDELVVPEPMPCWPETPASWVFAEVLCDQLVLLA
jgi:hypothetical protein